MNLQFGKPKPESLEKKINETWPYLVRFLIDIGHGWYFIMTLALASVWAAWDHCDLLDFYNKDNPLDKQETKTNILEEVEMEDPSK